ncbi:MAG: hypothetical protein J3K34DRAFT_9064 [Monoraphidium minutum]|nr:MAG: hypothetical protein J3K34DRAFT_9064 [Monoraphidium minutum]
MPGPAMAAQRPCLGAPPWLLPVRRVKLACMPALRPACRARQGRSGMAPAAQARARPGQRGAPRAASMGGAAGPLAHVACLAPKPTRPTYHHEPGWLVRSQRMTAAGCAPTPHLRAPLRPWRARGRRTCAAGRCAGRSAGARPVGPGGLTPSGPEPIMGGEGRPLRALDQRPARHS